MSGTLFILEISSEKKLKNCHQKYYDQVEWDTSMGCGWDTLSKEEAITQSNQNYDNCEPMELQDHRRAVPNPGLEET